LISCKKNSKFVYRNRTQLYGAYTSKYGNKAQQSCVYKRVSVQHEWRNNVINYNV